MQGLSNLTWLLPLAPLVFLLYLAYLIAGLVWFDLHIILLLLPLLPAIIVTWLALIVGFVDVSRRPKVEIGDEARLVWILLMALLNVLALLPYWLLVVRRQPPARSPDPAADPPPPANDTRPEA